MLLQDILYAFFTSGLGLLRQNTPTFGITVIVDLVF